MAFIFNKNKRRVNRQGKVNLRETLNIGGIKGDILNQARRDGDIIFGGRAIQKQIGLKARPTQDFDILTKDSLDSSLRLRGKLNTRTRSSQFFLKKGVNPGTWKVKSKGRDGLAFTKDDKGIADFTNFPKKLPKTRSFGGVKFRTIGEEKAAKIRVLKDPAFAFRHAKDRNDLNRINKAGGRFRKA